MLKNIKNIKKILPAMLRKTRMPAFIPPMLSHLVDKPFHSPEWLFEIKWDGFRIISYVENNKVRLTSRNQKEYRDLFSAVAKTLSQYGLSVVLDGEMTVLDTRGHANFQLLQQFQKTGEGRLVYQVFDVLWLNGEKLYEVPLIERKKMLKALLPVSRYLKFSDHILDNGETFFQVALAEGLEGIIAKKCQSFYTPGARSHEWLKIKTKQRQEAVIAGFTEPRGGRKGFGALVLGVYDQKKLKYIGHTGGGFNQQKLCDLHQRLHKLAQAECPFEEAPKTNMPVTWVKPKLVCEIAFQEWTKEGRMRQPIFVGMREDKPAKAVTREENDEIPKH